MNQINYGIYKWGSTQLLKKNEFENVHNKIKT